MVELLAFIVYEFTFTVYGNVKMIASNMLKEDFCLIVLLYSQNYKFLNILQ